MKVLLRNPRREIDVDGGRSVDRLLDDRLEDGDTIEVRPVISGGS